MVGTLLSFSAKFTPMYPFIHRLKRATDIIFGGMKIVVCGYGEVGTAARCDKRKAQLYD